MDHSPSPSPAVSTQHANPWAWLFAALLLLYPVPIFLETIKVVDTKIGFFKLLSALFMVIAGLNLLRSDNHRPKRMRLLFLLFVAVMGFFSLRGLAAAPLSRVLSVAMFYATPFVFFYSFSGTVNQGPAQLRSNLRLFEASYIIAAILGLFTIPSWASLVSRDVSLARWAGVFFSDMVGGYFYGIYALLFLVLYQLLREKRHLAYAITSLLFTFFSQTRMYVFALLVAIALLVFTPSIKRMMIAVLVCLLLFMAFGQAFKGLLIELPVIGKTFNTMFEMIDAYNAGMFDSSLDIATMNFSGGQYEYYSFLHTISDRVFIWVFLLTDASAFVGKGVGSCGVVLQEFFFEELDVSHSDPVTLGYEFGLVFIALYYIFYVLYANIDSRFAGHYHILLALCFFDFFSGLTSSNLNLAIPRVVLFFGMLIVLQVLTLQRQGLLAAHRPGS